jgi:hypothetical protein
LGCLVENQAPSINIRRGAVPLGVMLLAVAVRFLISPNDATVSVPKYLSEEW